MIDAFEVRAAAVLLLVCSQANLAGQQGESEGPWNAEKASR